MHSTDTERQSDPLRDARKGIADVADMAASEARAAGRTISSLVMDEIDRRGASLADGLDEISITLRHASAGQEEKSQLVEQAANVIDDIAERLREGTAQDIADQLVGIARRNPGAVVLTALAAGLLAGRVFVAHDVKDGDDRLHREGAYDRP